MKMFKSAAVAALGLCTMSLFGQSPTYSQKKGPNYHENAQEKWPDGKKAVNMPLPAFS